MTKQEAGRLGGLATYNKYGSKHMAKIGREGFYAAIASIADRQDIPVNTNVNNFRHFLKWCQSNKR